MLIRALLAMVAFTGVIAIHREFPYIETPLLVFVSAISLVSVFVPFVGKMAIGTLLISLEIGLAVFALLLLHFHAQSLQVQGVGLVLGVLATVPWLVGLGVSVAIRHRLVTSASVRRH